MNKIKNGYYTQFDGLDKWTQGSIVPITKGEERGRSYQVYTQETIHKNFSWRFKKGLLALISSIFIVTLASKEVRNLWKMAFTGKETKKIKLLLPASSQKPITPENQRANSETVPSFQNPPSQLKRSNPNQPSDLEKITPSQTTTDLQRSPTPIEETATKIETVKKASEKKLSVFSHLELIKDLIVLYEGRREPFEGKHPSICDVSIDDQLETCALPNPPEENTGFFVAQTSLESIWWLNCLDFIHKCNDRKNFRNTFIDEEHLVCVLEKIELLNRSIALFDRLNKNNWIKNEVQVRDIALPWSQSALKLILMTKKERDSILYGDITKFSPRQIAYLNKRNSYHRNNDIESNPKLNDVETLDALCLQELRQLPPAALNRLIDQIPIELYFLFTYRQLTSIDIEKLSDKQFKAIYTGSKAQLHTSPEVVNKVIERLKKLSSEALQYLPKELLQKLDFTDEALVDTVFFEGLMSNKERIADLTDVQLNICFKNGWMTKQLAKSINYAQLKNLDLQGLDLEEIRNAGLFTSMLEPGFFRGNPINSLSFQNLNTLLPYLDPSLIAGLDKEHIAELDINRISKEQFEELSKAAKPPYSTDLGHGIQELSVPQTLLALQRGLFSEATAPYISNQTLNAMDLTDELVEQMGGKKILNALVKNKINSIETSKIEKLLSHLDATSLKNIGRFKLQEICKDDPSRFINQEVIDALEKNIADLSFSQLLFALRNNFLNEKNAAFIPFSFLQQVELEQGDFNDGTKKVIETILRRNTRQIFSLKASNLNGLLEAFPPDLIKEFKEDQIKSLDIAKMTRHQFQQLPTALAPSNYFDEKHRAYRCLSERQIADALIKGFIDLEIVNCFESRQLQRVPFEEVIEAWKRLSNENITLLNCLLKKCGFYSVEPGQFKTCLPYLSDDNLKENHRVSNIATINFKTDLTKEKFEVFATAGNVREMSVDQVCDALNARLFTEKTAVNIQGRHIQAINFSGFSRKEIEELAPILNAMLKKEMHSIKIRYLTNENLAHLLPVLSEENLGDLRENEFQLIDFDREDLPEGILVRLLKTAKSEYGSREPQGLKVLTTEQIYDCLKRKLFNDETIKVLSYNQKHRLDKDKLNSLDPEGNDPYIKQLL